jgi:endonuclease/exonuclease/phosphatase family metal-dependent hydrolase
MKFSLLTYNIWSGKYLDEVIKFLEDTDADVMCLQEVGVFNAYHEESKDVDMRIKLQVAFPDHNLLYAPVGKRMVEGKEESFGNAILTRFPIAFTETHHLLHSLNWTENHEEQSRNVLEAELIIGDKSFTVVTGHLTYAPKFEDTDTQIKEAEKIVEVIKDKSPLIFAGDYNSHSNTEVFRILKDVLPNEDAQLDNTFARHPFSYNGFNVDSLEYKIDHILGTKDVRITNAKVVDVPYSDHLPILAEIDFN